VLGLKPAHGLQREGKNGPRRQHGGLSRAADRQTDWALAWRPGPAEEAAWWGLAGGKMLSASSDGVPGWRRAGGVEVGLTLSVARRAGAEQGVGAGAVAGVGEKGLR
jgi:hypothetical protein